MGPDDRDRCIAQVKNSRVSERSLVLRHGLGENGASSRRTDRETG